MDDDVLVRACLGERLIDMQRVVISRQVDEPTDVLLGNRPDYGRRVAGLDRIEGTMRRTHLTTFSQTKHVAPNVKPAPTPARTTRSPVDNLPAAAASARAIGMDAAPALPMSWTFANVRVMGT